MQDFIVSQYQKTKGFYSQYESLLMPAMLVVGFLVDYITFTSIQITTTLMVLFVYWVLAGMMIIFTHFYDSKNLSSVTFLRYIKIFSVLLLQFTFGALLGSSLVFYWFSGAFSVSWPLLAVLVLLMIFNEKFRHYVQKPLVQISIYFFCTISLASLALPYLFASLSAWLFVLASFGSLVLFLIDIHFLSLWIENLRKQKRKIIFSIFFITIIMNLLYFTNVIPPIPLALREAGIYHSLNVSQGKYILKGESENFLQSAIFGQTVHVKVDSAVAQGSGVTKEKIYLYTAIFAPTKLQTTIVHRWQHYDEIKKEWVDMGKLSFNINGGRKEGYKGYSWVSDLAEGRWRVYVQNQRGQVLGLVKFRAINTTEPMVLKEVIK